MAGDNLKILISDILFVVRSNYDVDNFKAYCKNLGLKLEVITVRPPTELISFGNKKLGGKKNLLHHQDEDENSGIRPVLSMYFERSLIRSLIRSLVCRLALLSHQIRKK